MPSFDIVSKADLQEVKNAVEQAKKELAGRYDFRGTKCSVDLEGELLIVLLADDKGKLEAVQEILRTKLAKRGVSLKCVKFQDPEPASGNALRQKVEVRQGLADDELKRVTKEIKAQKWRVTAQIQGEQLRVTGKQRDDLQEVMGHLRKAITDLELQFTNFRE
jgi:uncharacterized protein YajQ (UPF0234 family)